MIEAIGDVFTYGNNYGDSNKYVARVIPTNGITNAAGRAIMGRGVALQAATRYRTLPVRLGALILSYGNRVHELPLEGGPIFVSFPTKNDWRKPADLKLIERSAQELSSLIYEKNYDLVVMPRVGIGYGGLDWEDVKAVLLDIFWDEDRVVVVSLTDPDDPNDHLIRSKRNGDRLRHSV